MSTKPTDKKASAASSEHEVSANIGAPVLLHGEHKAADLKRDTEIAPEDLIALSASSTSAEQFERALSEKLVTWANEAIEEPAGARAGALIRAMRQLAGLSQATLGEKAQINQSDISAIETSSGGRGPTFDVLARVAEVCGFRLTFERKRSARQDANHELANVVVDRVAKSVSKHDAILRDYVRKKFHVQPKGKLETQIRMLLMRHLLSAFGEDEFARLVSSRKLEDMTKELRKDRTFMTFIARSYHVPEKSDAGHSVRTKKSVG